MSLEMDEFVQMIKQSSADTNESKKPFHLLFGTVVTPEPNLKIFVNQKLTLDEQQLILTNNVRDYTIFMTTAGEDVGKAGVRVPSEYENHYTEKEKWEAEGGGTGGYTAEQLNCFKEHNHKYEGTKLWTIHLALKIGEKVTLLRCDGGQKYIVLDRVEAPDERKPIRNI